MDKVEVREAIVLENEGKKIFGVLHRPLKEGKVPALLICSGFAGSKCGKFRIFVNLAKELANLGIAVLRFDYRGAGDSEGDFKEITLEGKLKDTLKCLEFLAADPQIDSSRLGLLGRSLGGAIAVLAACRYQTLKSLALWAPVFKSDPWRELWESFKYNRQLDESKKDMLRQLPAGIPNFEFLNQFFKLDLEKELLGISHIPLLHIHGNRDELVKVEHALDYEKARKQSAHTRFIQLPHSDHDFSDPHEQMIAIQETTQWVEKTLLN